MKRLICILLVAVMALGVFAYAENVQQPSLTILEPMTTEDKLYEMLPVLDSLTRNMGIEGEVAYSAADAEFFWTQLYLYGENWASLDPQVKLENGSLIVPSSVMWDFAKASFGDFTETLTIPEGFTGIRYDVAADAFVLTIEESTQFTYIVIERYATDADGHLLVSVGLYAYAEQADEADHRLGGLMIALSEAQTSDGSEPPYPYYVLDARGETDVDFADLTPTEAGIRYNPLYAISQQEAAQAIHEEISAAVESDMEVYTTLQKGSRGDAVRALQQRLNELGYSCGSADGVFGSHTRRAVRYFQDAIDANQSGIATAAMQHRLFADDAPEYVAYVTLSKGSSGIRVENLQQQLRSLGYMAASVDGDFGSRTKAAVELFQDTADLHVDGIAGPKTLHALASSKAPECDSLIELRHGDSGIRVKEMQHQLMKLGFLEKASGSYDKATVNAVAAFLDSIGMEGNGKTATVKMLKELFDQDPVVEPTVKPTVEPTVAPTEKPSVEPTAEPTDKPSVEPTEKPTAKPTAEPTAEPTVAPTAEPTAEPTKEPVCVLTKEELASVVEAANEMIGPMDEAEVVKWIQHRIKLPQTGIYDETTRETVMKLQKDHGMEMENGIADKEFIHFLSKR